jgi:hypothetical protein
VRDELLDSSVCVVPLRGHGSIIGLRPGPLECVRIAA